MRYLLRLYFTLRPLKWRQLWYRAVQPALKKYARLHKVAPADIAAATARPAVALTGLHVNSSYEPPAKRFRFLNIEAAFPDGIDWNFSAHGLLWAFNLNYFEWLYDDTLSVEDRLQTIHDYILAKDHIRVGLHGYPASLRIVAWTRFLLRFGVTDKTILALVVQHADWLCRFPEYQLDGNHLWENGIALICAGLFFNNTRFYKNGTAIIRECIRGQLCGDGGHMEGSPMYHSLLLWRLLQCIGLLRVLPCGAADLVPQLETAAGKMLGWLAAVTFGDGSWPAINDCTDGIAPSTRALMDYAGQLQVPVVRLPLRDSQYRMIRCGAAELFIDAAGIHLPYQPGHSHADIGTFCLHIAGRPIIVDTGISTYDDSLIRQRERGTTAHNTVCVNAGNSSEVWKSFRVGRRAAVTELHEEAGSIRLAYKDYRKNCYKRTYRWNDTSITITDHHDEPAGGTVNARLHIHPDVELEQTGPCTFIAGGFKIEVDGADNATICDYDYATGFNKRSAAKCITITIGKNNMKATIFTT